MANQTPHTTRGVVSDGKTRPCLLSPQSTSPSSPTIRQIDHPALLRDELPFLLPRNIDMYYALNIVWYGKSNATYRSKRGELRSKHAKVTRGATTTSIRSPKPRLTHHPALLGKSLLSFCEAILTCNVRYIECGISNQTTHTARGVVSEGKTRPCHFAPPKYKPQFANNTSD